jgi:hypothetical protein
MEIEFNTDIDDVLAYTLYYREHSPNTKKLMINATAIWAVLGFFFIFIGIMFIKNNNLALAGSIFTISLYLLANIFFVKSRARNNTIKVITNSYDTGKNGWIGNHILSITPDNIRSVSESSESTSKWDIIEQVISTGEYLFIIFRGSQGAYIVPKAAFADEAAFNQFYETAKKYHLEASASAKTV